LIKILGLRGAVAYSLAAGTSTYEPSDVISNTTNQTSTGSNVSEYLVTTTHSVVIVTIFLLGSTTAPMLKLLKLSGDHVKNVRENLKKDLLRAKRHSKWTNFDKKWLIPFFSKAEGRAKKLEKILDTEVSLSPQLVRDVMVEMPPLLSKQPAHHQNDVSVVNLNESESERQTSPKKKLRRGSTANSSEEKNSNLDCKKSISTSSKKQKTKKDKSPPTPLIESISEESSSVSSPLIMSSSSTEECSEEKISEEG